jgi:FixJ family two-component response regulator
MNRAALCGNPGILVVDDDRLLVEMLGNLISSWGMTPDGISEPLAVLERVRQVSHDVILLDVHLNGINGLDLIPKIRTHRPDTPIIIMSGYPDEETMARAPKTDAFDFLGKPFESAILLHSIRHALMAVDARRKLRRLVQGLRAKQARVLAHEKRLELLAGRLKETNRALTSLANSVELEREDQEKQMALKLKSLILPTINKLRRDPQVAKYEQELNLLVTQIEDMSSNFSVHLELGSILSSAEYRIACLIKHGLTAEEIAEHLHISPSTVRTHRKNIRKKLNINNAQYNLRNFLSSQFGGGSDR